MTGAGHGGTQLALLGYRFVARGPELHIEHDLVEPIVVRLEPFAFTVDPPSEERATLLPDAEPRGPVRFDLCDADRASAHVLHAIAARRRRRVPAPPQVIIRGHLLAARARGLRHLNPQAHAVQRSVLAVGDHVPRLACHPGFYEEPFLATDVVRYRAAACALASLEETLLAPWCALRGRPDGAEIETLLAAMHDWRSLFSPSGRPYRSLNRTLMNLPPGIPAKLLCHLRTIELERPLTAPFGLAAVLLHASDRRGARRSETERSQRKILERASEAEIAGAVADIGGFTGRALSAERLSDLGFAVRFLIDDPHPFRGSLPGLVRRAIRWHEGLRMRHRRAPVGRRPRPLAPPAEARVAPPPPRRVAVRPHHEVRTAIPPIALPEVPGIEFLASVERIRQEARLMDNCIASYARAAVAGDCYLFHVRHGGEHASVEIDPRGSVRQAEGPANSDNEAARWGAARLREWAHGLRELHRARQAASPGREAAARSGGQVALWPDLAR